MFTTENLSRQSLTLSKLYKDLKLAITIEEEDEDSFPSRKGLEGKLLVESQKKMDKIFQ